MDSKGLVSVSKYGTIAGIIEEIIKEVKEELGVDVSSLDIERMIDAQKEATVWGIKNMYRVNWQGLGRLNISYWKKKRIDTVRKSVSEGLDRAAGNRIADINRNAEMDEHQKIVFRKKIMSNEEYRNKQNEMRAEVNLKPIEEMIEQDGKEGSS